jgi:HD-like signal output (HDOD) protein
VTGTVLTTRVFEFPAVRGPLTRGLFSELEGADSLPAVPAMPETLLAMELQLQQRSADLKEISEAVLADLGATIQILRLAGREYGSSACRPVRIEDCISDLGLRACLNAAASGIVGRSVRQRSIHDLWAHSREIAHHARLIAERSAGEIVPDQAYMAGLLHSIGLLPALLGWTPGKSSGHRAFSSLRMAERWALPAFIKDFFCEMCMPGYAPEWSRLMEDAHHETSHSHFACLLDAVAFYPPAS